MQACLDTGGHREVVRNDTLAQDLSSLRRGEAMWAFSVLGRGGHEFTDSWPRFMRVSREFGDNVQYVWRTER